MLSIPCSGSMPNTHYKFHIPWWLTRSCNMSKLVSYNCSNGLVRLRVYTLNFSSIWTSCWTMKWRVRLCSTLKDDPQTRHINGFNPACVSKIPSKKHTHRHRTWGVQKYYMVEKVFSQCGLWFKHQFTIEEIAFKEFNFLFFLKRPSSFLFTHL